MATTKDQTFVRTPAMENALVNKYGSHAAALILENFRGENTHLWLLGTFTECRKEVQKKVRLRTSDVDLMSMEELDLILSSLQEVERQITLGDFLPAKDAEFAPKYSVVNTSVFNQLVDRVSHNHSEDILIELFDNMHSLVRIYHSMYRADKFKFIKFLISTEPHFVDNFVSVIVSEFKIPESSDAKILKKTANFNKKALARLVQSFEEYVVIRPLDTVERQGLWSELVETVSGLGSVVKNSNATINKVSDLVDSVNCKVESTSSFATTQAGLFVDKVTELVTKLEPVAEQVGDVRTLLEKVKQNCVDHSVALASQVYQLLTVKDHMQWFTSLVSITSMLGINKVFIDKMLDFFKPKLGFQASNTIKLLALASTFMGKYNPVHMIGMPSAFGAMKEVKALEELTVLLNEVGVEWGLWTSPEGELAKVVKEEVAMLLVDLVELEAMEANTPSKFLLDSVYKRVEDNYKKVLDLEVRFVKTRVSGLEGTTIVPELAKLHTGYKNLNNKVLGVRKGEARRQEPFAVVFLGEPGIGKSKFATDLISGKKSLLSKRFTQRKLGDKPQWAEMQIPQWNVWNENVSDKMDFSDGYCGQEIHATDDLFQSASDNDHNRYINYISPQRFITNQAALDSKGLPYTSKLFVGSCNKFPTSSKTIKEVGALQRRFMVVECKKIAPIISGMYDHDFKHLEFEVYPTGVDYVQGLNMTTMTKDELLDVILDGVQAKYKMYCEEMEFDYEFQVARGDNLRTDDRSFVTAKIASLEQIPDGSWTRPINDPDKAFLMMKVELPNGNLLPLQDVARIDSRYQKIEHILEMYERWIYTSKNSVKKMCARGCYYTKRVGRKFFIIMFYLDNGVETIKVFDEFMPTTELEHEEEDFWDTVIGTLQEEVYSVFGLSAWKRVIWNKYAAVSNIFAGIRDKVYAGMGAFNDWLGDPYSAVELFIFKMLVWLGIPYGSIMQFLLQRVSNMAVTMVISYFILMVYHKVTSLAVKDVVCKECNSTGDIEVNQILDDIKNSVCKDHCQIGYVYTTHNVNCENFTRIIDDFKIMCCSCEGSCEEDCCHQVEEQGRKYTEFRQVLQLHYGQVPAELDMIFSERLDMVFKEVGDYEMVCKKCGRNEVCDKHDQLRKLSNGISGHAHYPRSGAQRKKFERESGSSAANKKKVVPNMFESGSSATNKKKIVPNMYESGSSAQTKRRVVPVCPESGTSLTPKRRITPHVVGFEDGSETDFEYSFEMQTDPAVFTLVDPLMKCVKRCVRTRGGVTGSLNGLVYKNYIFTPGHFDDGLAYTYEFEHDNLRIRMELIHHDRERDIAMWKHQLMFSELLERHLATNDDIINYLPSADSCIMAVPAKAPYNFVHIMHCFGTYLSTHRLAVKGEGAVDFKQVLRVVGINNPNLSTSPGDCGSPLLMSHRKAARKVIGFHIMGGADAAYSTVFSKETFDRFLAYDEVDYEISEVFEPKYDQLLTNTTYPVLDVMGLCNHVVDAPIFAARGDIEYVGQYDYMSVPAKETSLIKHALYETFPVTAVPAALSNGEVEDPSDLIPNGNGVPDILQTQIDKYAKVLPKVAGLEEDLEDMVEQLTGHFVGVLKTSDLTKMTETEALSGVESWCDSYPLDMKTTAGEPFSRLGRTPGKKKSAFLARSKSEMTGRHLFNLDPSTKHGKYLVDVISEKEKLASNGYRTLSLWKNCLKDETRPLEKVKKGKTRLFTAAPFDTVFLARKYFGKFKECWQSKRKALFHSVGINPMSPHWSELAQDLLSRGSDFSDADFSSYDGNLRADFMKAAGKIVIETIMEVTGQQDRLAYEVIWSEFIETFHVSYRNIHLMPHGNPSGNPMTTVVNCIVNLMYHWWCYRKISGTTSLSRFTHNIGFTCFGDDVVFCSNEDITGYTFNEVAKWMKVLGQDYTTGDKVTGDIKRKTIAEIQFLKRKFVLQDGHRYIAPLDQESIEQQFNYTNVATNDYLTMAVQIQEASVEAVLHGREYFTYFKKSLDGAIRNNDLLRQNITCVDSYLDVLEVAMQRVLEQIS